MPGSSVGPPLPVFFSFFCGGWGGLLLPVLASQSNYLSLFSIHCFVPFLIFLLCPNILWAEVGFLQSKAYLSLLCCECSFALNTYLSFSPRPLPFPIPVDEYLYHHFILRWNNLPKASSSRTQNLNSRFNSRIWASFNDYVPDPRVDVKYMEDPNLTSRDSQNQVCTSGKKEMPCRE